MQRNNMKFGMKSWLFLVVFAVLLTAGKSFASSTLVNDTCDQNDDGNDIERFSAVYDSDSDELTVNIHLCDDVLDETIYRVRIDHTAPFFDEEDRDGNGKIQKKDTCFPTSDTGISRKGDIHTGLGYSDILNDQVVSFTVPVDDLNPNLMLGDTIHIWANTQNKGTQDHAPDLDGENECGVPVMAGETMALDLASTKLVFVTSGAYNGNLRGAANSLITPNPNVPTGSEGADAICNYHSLGAGLPGTYTAWINQRSDGPADGVVGRDISSGLTDVPFVRVDGTIVADDRGDLTDGTLDSAISVDELGEDLVNALVWTGTLTDGSGILSDSLLCGFPPTSSWADGRNFWSGLKGSSGAINFRWTNNNAVKCNNLGHLYCFQD